jgi:hypothetical protein
MGDSYELMADRRGESEVERAVRAERARCLVWAQRLAGKSFASDQKLALDKIRTGAEAPVRGCSCQFEAGGSPCKIHDCIHQRSPADCVDCNPALKPEILAKGTRVRLLNNVGEIEPSGSRNVEAYAGEIGVIEEAFPDGRAYYVKFKQNSCRVWRGQFQVLK